MLESFVTTCRVLACEARLLILYHLCIEGELTPSQIARRARLGRARVSDHLRLLTSLELLARRRSGRRVLYRLADGESRGPRAAAVALVRRAFLDTGWATRGWDEDTLVHVSERSTRTVPGRVARAFDVVFDAATAFANVRRLQILHLLGQHGPCSANTIVTRLRMSRMACWRHLDKLARRGYAHPAKRDRWALATRQRTPFHAALLKLAL